MVRTGCAPVTRTRRAPDGRREFAGRTLDDVDPTPPVDPPVTVPAPRAVRLTLYTSAFCEPCMQTRAVLAEAARLVPGLAVTERDVAREPGPAEADDIRSTPTVIVHSRDGAEVFRAEGVPTLNQVLVAAAKAV